MALALAVALLWTACNGLQIALLLFLTARERAAVLRTLFAKPEKTSGQTEEKTPLQDRLKQLKDKWREPAEKKGGEKK